ncbi:hypothetical protein CYMTET_47109 [Cymbomonas tetramitiformis]|uniref:Uncharacterized protein n=1 Tax=Cymbomonas tetramitiformis TaxID=36881 RepID=A0AAE0BW14_9CHLO|nr:hypothetical protein CYMTET_47109 [Cymbomonas tetramitiformis]
MGLPARAGTAGSRPSSATRKPGSAFSSAMQDDGTADRSAPSSSGFGLGTFLPQRSSSSGSRPSSASKPKSSPEGLSEVKGLSGGLGPQRTPESKAWASQDRSPMSTRDDGSDPLLIPSPSTGSPAKKTPGSAKTANRAAESVGISVESRLVDAGRALPSSNRGSVASPLKPLPEESSAASRGGEGGGVALDLNAKLEAMAKRELERAAKQRQKEAEAAHAAALRDNPLHGQKSVDTDEAPIQSRPRQA